MSVSGEKPCDRHGALSPGARADSPDDVDPLATGETYGTV